MDLIREILLEVERQPIGRSWRAHPMLCHDLDEVVEHVRLATDAGLLEGHTLISGDANVTRMTNAGYDFLEASRQQTLWEKAKEKLRAAGLPTTVYALKSALDILIRDGLSHLH